ncbi:MAG: TetR/AcrR family transcriptional regulator [Oscillibacter sp.]|jgi:AcrR family transcriptional regulator|nr:TetR/AcrR family transcriptional regulator [Oscillibacter sp.]
MEHTQYQCSAQTRQKLIDAVIRLAHLKNYRTITVQEICQSAGVSTGSFYHQFGTKDEVVMAAYQSVDWLLTDQFTAENRRLPPLEALDSLLRRYLLYARDEVGLVLAQYYKVLLNHPTPHRCDSNRPYCREIKRILLRAMDGGLISRAYDPEELTDAIMRLIRGLLFDWVIQGGAFDLLLRYRTEFQIFLGGIRISAE